jgi:rRNA-processing protein FCF1
LQSLLKDTIPIDTISTVSECEKFLNILSTCSFTPAFLKECKTQIALVIEKISAGTPEDWDRKVSVLRMCGRTSFEAQLKELIGIATKNSEKELVEYSRAVSEVLKKHGMSSEYSKFLQRLLPVFLGDKKVPLDTFVNMVENLTQECENTNIRKGIYCQAEQCVMLPETWIERIDFAKKCINHGIPPLRTIFLNNTAEHIVMMNWANDTERAGFLNNLPQLSPLMDLNAVGTALAHQIGITTLCDYTILPSGADYKEIKNLCSEWQKKWKRAANFFDKPENYCKSTIAIVQKIFADVQEALRLMNRKKYIIFDTCALIHQPDILQRKPLHGIFVIPKVVLQELDCKKKDFTMSDDDRKNVREAIRLIHKNTLRQEDSAIDLLPEDYRRNPANDDLILSVALKFVAMKEDVTLVSDDINFSNKCSGENIPVLTVKQCYQKIPKKEL